MDSSVAFANSRATSSSSSLFSPSPLLPTFPPRRWFPQNPCARTQIPFKMSQADAQIRTVLRCLPWFLLFWDALCMNRIHYALGFFKHSSIVSWCLLLLELFSAHKPDGRENRHVCSVVIQKENHASLKISLGSFSSFISQEILEMKFSKFIMIIKKNYIDKECTKNKI